MPSRPKPLKRNDIGYIDYCNWCHVPMFSQDDISQHLASKRHQQSQIDQWCKKALGDDFGCRGPLVNLGGRPLID